MFPKFLLLLPPLLVMVLQSVIITIMMRMTITVTIIITIIINVVVIIITMIMIMILIITWSACAKCQVVLFSGWEVLMLWSGQTRRHPPFYDEDDHDDDDYDDDSGGHKHIWSYQTFSSQVKLASSNTWHSTLCSVIHCSPGFSFILKDYDICTSVFMKLTLLAKWISACLAPRTVFHQLLRKGIGINRDLMGNISDLETPKTLGELEALSVRSNHHRQLRRRALFISILS